MREDLKEYFNFSRSQSQGIILLSVLCLLAIGFYFSLDYWVSPPKQEAINDAEIEKILASIYVDTSAYKKEFKPQKLFPFNFNPNTLSEAGFVKLGLRPRLAKTILNYRNKGGQFYKKEDFKKIWGLHEDEYKQLAPYISIPKQKRQYAKSSYKNYERSNTSERPRQNLNIEINSATADQLIELNGIAEKLASNILKYRKMLGGFHSVTQIKEVYGIRPETFDKIKKHLKCNSSSIEKVNINEATLNEMKRHPYLRKDDLGLKITRFRKSQDYEIKTLKDLKQIEGMTDALYNRLVPYLRLK
jgi:competence ComEA-like helix-hairpin-helix protein